MGVEQIPPTSSTSHASALSGQSEAVGSRTADQAAKTRRRAEARPLSTEESEDRAAVAAEDTTRVLGKEETEQEVHRLTDILNEAASLLERSVHFRVFDEASPERPFVEVRDLEENEIIRQIPPEELLDVASRIDEMIGLLVDQMA